MITTQSTKKLLKAITMITDSRTIKASTAVNCTAKQLMSLLSNNKHALAAITFIKAIGRIRSSASTNKSFNRSRIEGVIVRIRTKRVRLQRNWKVSVQIPRIPFLLRLRLLNLLISTPMILRIYSRENSNKYSTGCKAFEGNLFGIHRLFLIWDSRGRRLNCIRMEIIIIIIAIILVLLLLLVIEVIVRIRTITREIIKITLRVRVISTTQWIIKVERILLLIIEQQLYLRLVLHIFNRNEVGTHTHAQ